MSACCCLHGACILVQAVVAKVYKSLLPHQAAAGYSMAPAKSCLSQKPVAAWDLEETLQTAVIKTLTGCSSGTAAHHNNNSNSTTITSPAASAQDSLTTTAAAAAAQPVWMGLSRHKLVGSNLLAAIPGVVSTAPFVEMEAKYDAGGKGLLLLVHAAGKRFSTTACWACAGMVHAHKHAMCMLFHRC